MELAEVIRLHLVDFNDLVLNPVSLASRLPSLRARDREQIECKTRYSDPWYSVSQLCDLIIGKVKWPELYAALREENLTVLAKSLHEEYYRLHPTAQPISQDEKLNPELNPFEQKPSDSIIDSNINDRASARVNINFLATADSNVSSSSKASLEKNVKDGASVVIFAQTVNVQCGDNNCMNIISNVEHEGSTADTADTECGEQYDECVKIDVSKSLDKNESQENMFNNSSPITGLYSRLPNEPATLQNISRQFSSSSSDSQYGGSPKVCCPNETAEHTSEKVIFEERSGDKMVYPAPSDNISSHDNTNTMSESHGHSELGGVICFEEFGITMHTGVRRCEEGEEVEDTELKKLA